MNENRLSFVTNKGQLVGTITREYIPRVGDNIQFREGVFQVKQVTYVEDTHTPHVHIQVVPLQVLKVARQDNHGNR